MSIQNIQNITTDFSKNSLASVSVKQYDKNTRFLIVKCTDNGKFTKLDKSSMACNIKILTPDDRAIFNTCEILDDGTVKVPLSESTLFSSGIANAELSVTNTSEEQRIGTMKFRLIIDSSVYSDDKIIASDEFNALTDLINKANTDYTYVITEAKKSANAAKVSETNAKKSETNASTSAANAKTSETNAKNSETNASDSATKAKTSETNSANSEKNAKTSETNSKTSETNSKASEKKASASATSAQDSANTATSKASEASSSATSAKNSATSSATSASNAKTSEDNAKSSASKAKTSETNAKASETNSAISEKNAKTYMKNAFISATTASSKADEAASSANSASASENTINIKVVEINQKANDVESIKSDIQNIASDVSDMRDAVAEDKTTIEDTIKNSLLASSEEILAAIKDYYDRAQELYNSMYIDCDGETPQQRVVTIVSIDCGTPQSRLHDTNGILFNGGTPLNRQFAS